jgi:23S rRNA (cytidine1920-2'-O)/16S rRNA (cytidine1409-2'-O)-methyltransferase
MSQGSGKFVSRAGEKLDAALEAFRLDVSGVVCADFGCNIGGFTDCLLQRGAAKVYAVDTGYGALAWRLRKDPRVVVMERTNALYVAAPEPVDLIVIDVAWTPQALAVPAAARWLKPAAQGGGRIVSLLKPHYELAKSQGRKRATPLTIEEARSVCAEGCGQLDRLGLVVLAVAESVLRGKGGNAEFLLLLEPAGYLG